MLFNIFILNLLCLSAVVQAEMFTSMAHLESLLNVEHNLHKTMDEYIEMEKKRINELREIAKNFKESSQQWSEVGLEALARNPLNRFRRFKRLTAIWKLVSEMIKTDEVSEYYIKNITGFPTDEDLRGTSQALFRLQDVYRLKPRDMANGNVQGTSDTPKMNAHDCFELGRQAYFDRDYYHSILWMDEALSRVRREKSPTVAEWEIMDIMSVALYHQGNLKQAYNAVKKASSLNSKHERLKNNVDWFAEAMKKEGLKKNDPPPPITNMRPDDYDNEERELFESLCRGESFQTESQKSQLYCYYKRDRPYLKLAGIKVEIVHLKPMVVIFREVLSDREIEIIKDVATPMLQRATVFNRYTNKLEHAEYRITKSAWLKNHHHPAIAQINNRLDDMTNLDQLAAEDFQVANYGLGGHYSPHFDMSTKGESDPYEDGQGNRVATVLFYLNAPMLGGYTVFLPVKLGLAPSKNDAAFWYNLRRNGEPDERTRHAACPVLAGQKWVSNKWIHEVKQEFRRPCGLLEDEEDYRIFEFM